MNRKYLLFAALSAAIVVGVVIGRLLPIPGGVSDVSVGEDSRQILYWHDPMLPDYRSDGPGKSPMGMDLVPVYAKDGSSDSDVVVIDPAIVNRLGVRTAQAEFGPLSRRIDTVGYIGYDEDTLQHIHTRVDGWIEKLSVTATGDPVSKGQSLFELYSPTLVNAQQEYLAAISQSSSLQVASRDRLLALGLTADEVRRLDKERAVRQHITVSAPEDGFVTNLGVREGIFITPETEVMSVARLDRVWVQAEVFERQSAWVSPGQRAEIELDSLPGETWQGAVDYVYPELDEKTRTLRVRLRFANDNGMLRPNMFTRVTLFGSATEPVVHVPREALIRGGKTDRVVLALGNGRFLAQPVRTGIETGDRVVILNGLSAGDRVVTSAQFLIDSESNIDSALARMDGSATDDAPTDTSADHSQHQKENPE